LIQAIRLNRHAIVLLDRDKDDGTLKEWAERVIKELEASGGLPWVTYGKEVENYIPHDVLKQYTGMDDLEEPERFANIIDLIKKILDRKTMEKVALAEKICPLITKELVSKTSDLEEKVKSASSHIRRWNARPPRF
jgi:putative ATP-dependent endonuclease of the OLD family